MHSFIRYNVINDDIGECTYVTENSCIPEGYKKIRERTAAGWNNGDMIFLIDGDWRTMSLADIRSRCLENLSGYIMGSKEAICDLEYGYKVQVDATKYYAIYKEGRDHILRGYFVDFPNAKFCGSSFSELYKNGKTAFQKALQNFFNDGFDFLPLPSQSPRTKRGEVRMVINSKYNIKGADGHYIVEEFK